ncbi:MAG: DUF2330 domain-containing protein [Sedimentisphaerales bacterium]|nr:DUF2330 domain-containing protein [Sedimentisphaerales bacterium]
MDKATRLLVLAIVLASAATTCGDGKFFVAEKVPTGVPYQRAFLFFHEGSEALVLQSKYELPRSAGVDSLGWVVPVPAVPELASMDAATAKYFFRRLSFRTQPRPHHIRTCFGTAAVVIFLAALAFLLVCLIEYPFLSRMKLSRAAWHRRARAGALIVIFTFFFAVTTMMPHLGRASAGGVEVLKAEQVGVYGVKVIRGDTAEAILRWLTDNGFAFGTDDKDVFQNYVDHDWCFVTAKVQTDPNTPKERIVAEGLAAPLILQFDTESPVYPLALTSVAGTKTEVLLYTLSDTKLTCGERLPLRHARTMDSKEVLRLPLLTADVEKWPLLDNVPDESMMLCKFKGRLTPERMKQDLIFEAAADSTPYRETKVVW